MEVVKVRERIGAEVAVLLLGRRGRGAKGMLIKM